MPLAPGVQQLTLILMSTKLCLPVKALLLCFGNCHLVMVLTTHSTVYRGLVRPDVMDGSVSYITLNSCGITSPQCTPPIFSCQGLLCVGIDLLQSFSKEFVWVVDV